MSLITHNPASATVVPTEPVTCRELTRSEIEALNANLNEKAAPWYTVYSGPHYSAYGTDNVGW